jgi:hypothetical protein
MVTGMMLFQLSAASHATCGERLQHQPSVATAIVTDSVHCAQKQAHARKPPFSASTPIHQHPHRLL